MKEYKCVKCGMTFQSNDPDIRKRWNCAPSCPDCREDVQKETKKQYSMWPSDYVGGWLWADGEWIGEKR